MKNLKTGMDVYREWYLAVKARQTNLTAAQWMRNAGFSIED
jgi:hypothetical protein